MQRLVLRRDALHRDALGRVERDDEQRALRVVHERLGRHLDVQPFASERSRGRGGEGEGESARSSSGGGGPSRRSAGW